MNRWLVFRSISFAVCLFSLLLLSGPSLAQISGTGAIAGTVTDASGAVVPGASITATNIATGLSRQVTSSGRGEFSIQLLQPGAYKLEVTKAGFATSRYPNVTVNVTQITGVNAVLKPGSTQQTVNVTASGQMLQTQSSTLGSVVTGEMVQSLPLSVRNYTQIITLSPGVASEVTNASEFGRGGGGGGNQPQDVPVAAGTNWTENNFQMDGVGINDTQGSGNFSGGVAIPNPDTIAEFKVQTSQYDASYGRNAGANVNLVTKTGTNDLHGSIWEFFRNEALNANDYFRKQTHSPRAVLRQNQPGMTLGGPIQHDKIFYFLSYQSTRQQNGVDPQCSTTLNEPPLTNDRSRAALGVLFAGQPTFVQELTGLPLGPTVLPDGSNIAPQALALFNLKLPSGQYAIPTPQSVNGSLPFSIQGVSTLSSACRFNEDQFMTNGEWDQSSSSQWQARFFFANSQQAFTFPTANIGGETAPGFPLESPNHYRNFSLINNHVFSANLLNQAEFGFHRSSVYTKQEEPFQYSDIGAVVPSFDTQPAISFYGGISLGGNGQSVYIAQNSFIGKDTVSWTHGNHAFRFGGGVNRDQDNNPTFQYIAGILFGTYPDALLGQSAAQNGTPLSNMYLSVDLPGELGRAYRRLSYDAYAQDDYRVTPRLTLNLGFRYERNGDLSDALGRISNFNTNTANPNPPASGSLQGFEVPSNYNGGTLPPGVARLPGKVPYAGEGQNTLNPRVGFAWQFPDTERVVVRGGYGIFHETVAGNPFLQLVTNQPYALIRELEGASNGAANWAHPIAPFTGTFPTFFPYSPTTSLSLNSFANNTRPPFIQHYSLDTQSELARNMVLEVGYLGTRGQHILVLRAPNQALSASPGSPIRGQTNNTFANIPLRVPIEGFSTNTFVQLETTGSTWYNALLANFTKRFQNGSEVQIAYTWSQSLSDSATTSVGANGGTRVGDQNDARVDYGPDEYNRPNRLVANFVYQIPTPFRSTSLAGETLGGWTATGVVTIQSGHWLYATNTNALNAFGTTNDFAELSPTCVQDRVGTQGSVTNKVNGYFNKSCFYVNPDTATQAPYPYPVIGGEEPPNTCAVHLPDGNCPAIATGFGNSRTGLLRGPAQNNFDAALQKTFPFSLRGKQISALFRAEAFNVFNAPQFSDPDTSVADPTFGVITTTAVNPRIMQLAVKFSF